VCPQNGKTINGKVHWVDAFFYNSDTETYEVRVSPEIMPYLINLTKSFTTFNAKTAMLLTSKFGQKFYELCSQFSTDYQHIDKQGRRYKKNVIPIDIENFRRIFNLEDVIDPRTKKIITYTTRPKRSEDVEGVGIRLKEDESCEPEQEDDEADCREETVGKLRRIGRKCVLWLNCGHE